MCAGNVIHLRLPTFEGKELTGTRGRSIANMPPLR